MALLDLSKRKVIWVIVAKCNGKKYFKSEADGDEPNNLLSLPRCRGDKTNLGAFVIHYPQSPKQADPALSIQGRRDWPA